MKGKDGKLIKYQSCLVMLISKLLKVEFRIGTQFKVCFIVNRKSPEIILQPRLLSQKIVQNFCRFLKFIFGC